MSCVLRLKKGDRLTAFDGESKEYECKIIALSEKKAELEIFKTKRAQFLEEVRITLACAIPKKAKMDFIVEKVTELGVHTIIPLHTHRTIVDLEGERARNRLRRWQAIAKETSKQCARIELPKIEAVTEFKDIVMRAKEYDMALIPHLGIKNVYLKDIVLKNSPKSVIVFIGPEGDFSEAEIRQAKENGCQGVSLGALTLKVDTAAIAVAAFLRFFYG